ncbi:MAG TPA: BCD family MFS transporter [Roseiflexaceae bacterium]|nr:BCD family MFS transporter [Roseiflexaceae bacterium]
MPLTKILRLGLINMAVALTAVPIDGTLNRVMISELGIPASLTALLIALPYLTSPLQVWIGGYSDRHPLFGYRRTPYIALGLLLCALGSALAPGAAFALAGRPALGLPLCLLAFGAWGMGFNFATVSYLALATELAGEEHRARTVGAMWFILIVGVIVAGVGISRALHDYTPSKLLLAFYVTCGLALLVGLGALAGLERRGAGAVPAARRSFGDVLRTVAGTPQARLFFAYLILLLVAILGQDVLLEPFAADVFGAPVETTTRYTSIWGAALLVALLLTGPLARRVGKARAAGLGAALVTAGLLLIALSGALQLPALFVPSLVLFGFGSGISTAANLALMLDMTLPGQVGAFVGAWGVADALARLVGTLLSGVLRDAVASLSGSKPAAYVTVFGLQALAMLLSLALLPRISVARFRDQAAPTASEIVGMVGETRG